MLTGLIGKKIGMTQMTDAAGRVRAATVLTLGPCTVSQVKTAATDGYEAVQVTFGKKQAHAGDQRASAGILPRPISRPASSRASSSVAAKAS